jgi:hypothetical protein
MHDTVNGESCRPVHLVEPRSSPAERRTGLTQRLAYLQRAAGNRAVVGLLRKQQYTGPAEQSVAQCCGGETHVGCPCADNEGQPPPAVAVQRDAGRVIEESTRAVLQEKGGGGTVPGDAGGCNARPVQGLVQAKLVVGAADDRFEREADSVVDSVVRGRRVEVEQDFEDTRRADGGDAETDGQDQGEVEPKRLTASTPPEATPIVQRPLESDGAAGSPLPADGRAKMEHAFETSFAAVPTHSDPGASELTRGIGAEAFTHDPDTYFDASRWDAHRDTGRRLLAPEVTHRIPQGEVRSPGSRAARPDPQASPVRVSPITPVVQRQPGHDKPPAEEDQPTAKDRRVAVILFNKVNKEIGAIVVTNPDNVLPGLAAGVYQATLTSKTLTVEGQPPEKIDSWDDVSKKLLKQASSFIVTVTDSSRKIKPGDEKSDSVPATGPATGKPGKGESGGPSRSGSKYGHLGGFHLPAPLAKVLDAMVDEETMAIVQLLLELKELFENGAEFKQLLTNEEKLLDVALGLDTSQLFDSVEKWAMAPPRKRVKAPSGKLAGVATKLLHVIDVLRSILGPVFRARTGFIAALELVALALEEVPLLEDVLGASPEERQKPDFQQLLNNVVDDLSRLAQEAFAGARKKVELVAANLTEGNLVTREEIARALTEALVDAAPLPYKAYTMVATKLGLTDAISDEVIAPALPQDGIDVINDLIKSVLKTVAPLIKAVTAGIDEVLAGIEAEVKTSLGPELKALLVQRTPLDGPAGVQPHSAGHIKTRLAASSSRPLTPKRQQAIEHELGQPVGDIRVHTDAAAASETEDLRAKAATIGRDAYSGPGRWAPGSPEGLHPLAPEVAHVSQQGNGGSPAQVQRIPKDATKKLGQSVTAKALGLVSGLVKPSAETLKRGTQIKVEVDQLIGKKVMSQTNPTLPADAYTYIQDKKTGALIGIRRRLKFMNVPGVRKLKINSGRITESLIEKLDPIKLWKKAERAKLARALGCSSGEEAHHVVSLELFGIAGIGGHPVANAAVAAGFVISGPSNGICLSEKVHGGSHPNYTGRVRKSLDAYIGLSAPEQLAGCRKVAAGYLYRLRNRTEKLD